MTLLLPAMLCFIGVAVVLGFALARLRRLLPVDRPNERSLHSAPVPRIGGMVIMAVVVPVALGMIPDAFAWVAPMAMLAIVSGVDDVRGLPVSVRFGVQAVVAAWAVSAAMAGQPLWAVTIAWFLTVWMTNLYNFMDGSDGLAGGMAVFGFGTYAVAASLAGDPAMAAACGALAAAAGAFLLFNFNPARVFMGDAGSVPLGFLAALFGIVGWRAGHWSPLFPALVFSPFVVDATVTLLMRLQRGERLWHAHRTHYYQRLIQLGLGHRRTALFEYMLMAGASVAALAGNHHGRTLEAAAVCLLVFVAIGWTIDRRWASRPVSDAA